VSRADIPPDCTKLSIYVVFFFILFSFNGLPIHIMRDLFMTGRAVVKRGTALWKYRRAVEDMNKYADATAEDLAREDTCIICREDMRPWDPVANPAALQRVRPKKLPCGHILHMGCLKSWLERQQVCPTCRRSVVISNPGAAPFRGGRLPPIGLGPGPIAGQQGQQPAANGPGQAAPAQPARPLGGARIFNLGALRIGFAQGGENIQELAQRMNEPRGGAAAAPAAQPAPAPTPTVTTTPPDMATLREQFAEMERALQRQAEELQHDQQQFQLLQLLFAELARVRQHQQLQQTRQTRPDPAAHGENSLNAYLNQVQAAGEYAWPPTMSAAHRTPTLTRHGVAPNAAAIPAGSPDLPEGVVLPPGWSLMPLQRLDGAGVQQTPAPAEPPATAPTNGNGTTPTQAQDATDTPTPNRTVEATPATNGAARPSTNGRHPDIIAPNPVLPNWAGENQLFGHTGSSSSREPSGDPPAGAAEKAPAAADRPRADDEDSSKGKAKAVTVEDAEDEEED
jgi:E3 ubiquitin-protein ligase synoviolin